MISYDLYERKVSSFLEPPPAAISVALLTLQKNGVEGSMECTVNQGCYKIEFETVNCWALKAAGKGTPLQLAICQLMKDIFRA